MDKVSINNIIQDIGTSQEWRVKKHTTLVLLTGWLTVHNTTWYAYWLTNGACQLQC